MAMSTVGDGVTIEVEFINDQAVTSLIKDETIPSEYCLPKNNVCT